MDKKAQEVGTIIDVFGPVKFPYVAIKPKRGYDPQKLVGQMLYLYKKWWTLVYIHAISDTTFVVND